MGSFLLQVAKFLSDSLTLCSSLLPLMSMTRLLIFKSPLVCLCSGYLFSSSRHSTFTTLSRPFKMSLIEQAKKKAAYQAVDEHVKDSHRVIGVGSGSTVVYVVERLLQRDAALNAKTVFVPTSFQSRGLLIDGGLTVGDVEQYSEIDVTIDGADEVDEHLNAIKGGGGAHLQEKVVAEAAKKFVIVADYRKNSKYLGEQWSKGVPVEVVPMAWKAVLRKLQAMGSTNAKLRMAVAKAGPVVTDNSNFIIDAPFGHIENPVQLLKDIKLITGVVEVGLFCNMAEIAYFGNEDGSVTIRTKP